MLSIRPRDEKGNYLINKEAHISVTTVQDSVCGMFESLMNNYHCKLCKEYNENIFQEGVVVYSDLDMGIVHAKNDRKGKGDYGSMAHEVLENVFFNKLPVPVDFAERVRQIKEIYEPLGLELVCPETTLRSKKLLSAGTTDVIAISRKFSNVRLYIVDYKSGSANKKKEAVQLGAYGNFIVEMIKAGEIYIPGLPDKFAVHGLVLHIGRSADEKVKPTFLSPELMKLGGKAYKSLLDYYRYTKLKLQIK